MTEIELWYGAEIKIMARDRGKIMVWGREIELWHRAKGKLWHGAEI